MSEQEIFANDPNKMPSADPRRISKALLTPVLRLTVSLGIVLLALTAALTLRVNQPAVAPDLLIASHAGGLGIQLPGGTGTLLALSLGTGTPIAIPPDLGIEDPDMLASYANRARFKAAQGQVMDLVRRAVAEGAPLTGQVQPDDGGAVQTITLPVTLHTQLRDLPTVFWVQIVCGTIVLMIAAFFFALRRGAGQERSAEGLAGFVIAGLGVGGAAYSAAIYSSRTLVMDVSAMGMASASNHVFTLTFGIGMIALFARYPRPVMSWRAVRIVGAILVISILLYRLELAPSEVVRPQNLTALIFLAIVSLIFLQLRATRRDPADRAALRWLGMSFVLGSGVFIMLVALPVALERESIMSQGLSFIPLCAIYVGTALAFSRYRLFDLDRWAWRFLFHMAVVMLLVCIDLVVMLTLSVSGTASMAFAVLVVGLIYFPLRDQVFERWFSRRRPDLATIYADTVSIAFQIGIAAKTQAWRLLMQRLFAPLQIEPATTEATTPQIEAEGIILIVPSPTGTAPLRLSYADEGRRLFNHADLALVVQVNALVQAAEADRMAYEEALTQERRRIARDLHDDVGANLLSGLHAKTEAQRQTFLVEALADLRQIAAGIAGRSVTLEDQIAEMRAESRSRAEAQGGRLIWPLGSADHATDLLGYQTQRNLTAILREALSNALAHGGGGEISVSADYEPGQLRLRMENPMPDETPAPAEKPWRGNGIANMSARAGALQGTLTAQADPVTHRFVMQVVLPLAQANGTGETGGGSAERRAMQAAPSRVSTAA